MENIKLSERAKKNFWDDILLKIGIDHRIKSHPAYNQIINQIEGIISRMNILNEEDINVSLSEGTLKLKTAPSASWATYDFSLSCYEGGIRCSNTESKFTGNGSEKNFENTTIKIQDNNELIVSEDYAKACTLPETLTTNIGLSETIIKYNSDGIMMEREYRSVPEFSKKGIVTRDLSRGVLGQVDPLKSQTDIERCTREQYDVVQYFERQNGEVVCSCKLPLNQERGLQNIIITNFKDPSDIIIDPKFPEDVEADISREEDPRVQEGLRKLAQGREKYKYTTLDDPYFINNPITNTTKTR